MQSVYLKMSKRLCNSSQPLWRISPSLVAHGSTTSSSPLPSSPPISAAANANGSASTLNNLLTAPWFAAQSRGINIPGSDVRVGNLIENRGRAHEVLKLYREGTGNAAIKVPAHTVAGYATAATATKDGTKRNERKSGLKEESLKPKREQLLLVTAIAPLFLIYPNAYSLMVANFLVFWHIKAGIEEILADYVHHEMTREFVMILFRLFLIIAVKDVTLNFVFV